MNYAEELKSRIVVTDKQIYFRQLSALLRAHTNPDITALAKELGQAKEHTYVKRILQQEVLRVGL